MNRYSRPINNKGLTLVEVLYPPHYELPRYRDEA